MEIQLSEDELKQIRMANDKAIDAQSRLAHAVAMIDSYEKQKLSAIMNYNISIEGFKEVKSDIAAKYDLQEGFFDIDLTTGNVIVRK